MHSGRRVRSAWRECRRSALRLWWQRQDRWYMRPLAGGSGGGNLKANHPPPTHRDKAAMDGAPGRVVSGLFLGDGLGQGVGLVGDKALPGLLDRVAGEGGVAPAADFDPLA